MSSLLQSKNQSINVYVIFQRFLKLQNYFLIIECQLIEDIKSLKGLNILGPKLSNHARLTG